MNEMGPSDPDVCNNLLEAGVKLVSSFLGVCFTSYRLTFVSPHVILMPKLFLGL